MLCLIQTRSIKGAVSCSGGNSGREMLQIHFPNESIYVFLKSLGWGGWRTLSYCFEISTTCWSEAGLPATRFCPVLEQKTMILRASNQVQQHYV